jgi:K+ transporter
VLAVTGCEVSLIVIFSHGSVPFVDKGIVSLVSPQAIFANLGQFTPSSIRMGFVCAYVALVLTYLGQGARIIVDGEDVLASPFYKSIPGPTGGGLYWIVFAWAILACVSPNVISLINSDQADFAIIFASFSRAAHRISNDDHCVVLAPPTTHLDELLPGH